MAKRMTKYETKFYFWALEEFAKCSRSVVEGMNRQGIKSIPIVCNYEEGKARGVNDGEK